MLKTAPTGFQVRAGGFEGEERRPVDGFPRKRNNGRAPALRISWWAGKSLWLARVSATTVAPGTSVGARHRRAPAGNASPLIGPSSRKGAMRRSWRRLVRNVSARFIAWTVGGLTLDPVTMGNRGGEPCAARSPATGPGHVRLDQSFAARPLGSSMKINRLGSGLC